MRGQSTLCMTACTHWWKPSRPSREPFWRQSSHGHQSCLTRYASLTDISSVKLGIHWRHSLFYSVRFAISDLANNEQAKQDVPRLFCDQDGIIFCRWLCSWSGALLCGMSFMAPTRAGPLPDRPRHSMRRCLCSHGCCCKRPLAGSLRPQQSRESTWTMSRSCNA